LSFEFVESLPALDRDCKVDVPCGSGWRESENMFEEDHSGSGTDDQPLDAKAFARDLKVPRDVNSDWIESGLKR